MADTTPMPTASDLLRAYVNAWLEGDPEALLAVIADDAVVIESHGPTFLGPAEIGEWIEQWVARGDVVRRWDLLTMVESLDGSTVAAEWDFECTTRGVDYHLLGATIASVSDGQITRITEYRRELENR